MNNNHPHYNNELQRFTLAEGDSILYHNPQFSYMVDGWDENHREYIWIGELDISIHVREHAQSIALDASNGDGERKEEILAELIEDEAEAIAYIKAWAGVDTRDDDDDDVASKTSSSFFCDRRHNHRVDTARQIYGMLNGMSSGEVYAVSCAERNDHTDHEKKVTCEVLGIVELLKSHDEYVTNNHEMYNA